VVLAARSCGCGVARTEKKKEKRKELINETSEIKWRNIKAKKNKKGKK